MSSSPKILSLQGKGLKLDTEADIEPWIKGLDPTAIEEIHLGGNTIGVDASKALAEFLAKATSLKIADFADIFTGRLISEIPLALTAICDALIDKTTLVEINLSDNAFGSRSVDPMVPFLTHNRSFQVLRLDNNGLGTAGGTVIANALLESAKLSRAEGKSSSLRTVICGRNHLGNGSALAWADAFATHGTLVEVRMPQNRIGMDGITALARGLSKCGHLQYLDFRDNTFTLNGSETGVKAWADALPYWPELQTLNFSDCLLSGNGEVPLIVEALAGGSNPKLKTLQLQNNNLETNSFAVLAEGISLHLPNLRSLELQLNEVEEEDENVEGLSDALKQRGGKLFMSDEEEDAQGEDAIAEENFSVAVDNSTDGLIDILNKVSIH